MRRPPAELRKIEEEARRRELAHRRLRRERRLRVGLWILGVAALLLALGVFTRMLGLPVG